MMIDKTRKNLCRALLFGTCALSACGGGGGGAPSPAPVPAPVPAPTPVPAPAPSASDFLVAGIASADTTQARSFYAVDPAAPASPRFTTALPAFAGGVATPVAITSWDGTWRVVSRPTVDIHGSSHAYYVQNGKVFDVSLRKSEAQTAKQLSTLASACDVLFRWQNESTGNDTWLQVAATLGGGAACASTAYVRTTMDGTTGAVVLPAGVTLLAPLGDITASRTVGFLMRDASGATPKLVFYDTNLHAVADVVGGNGANDVSLVYFESSGQGLYLKVDNTLRHLAWTSNGASLSGSLYAFTGGLPSTIATADGGAVYFADGARLLKVTGANPAATLATLAPNVIFGAAVTDNYVVLLAAAPAGTMSLVTVPKAGGSAIGLANATSLSGVLPFFVGARGDRLFYARPIPFNPQAQSGAAQLRAVDANGQNDTLLIDNTIAIPVLDPSVAFNTPQTLGALVCPPLTSTTCALGEYDFATGTTTSLGTFATLSPSTFFITPTGTGGIWRGLPSWISTQGTSGGITRQDMYVVTPGSAGSLARITSNVP